MERLKNITIIFLLAVGLLSFAAPPACFANRGSEAKPTGVLLQEGLYAEEVDGDLDAAIRIYEQIIKDTSAQRSHIAQAMYRQGMCYLKKQNEQQAKEVFGKLVANYSDQTKIVDKVKPMLDDLSNADPAALMPPETLIYIETGSPGRQIETILNMLKGTPFENPLAAIGGGREPRPNLGGKSPGDMVAALMNPAMIAEFKKIRGMGVGVTGIALNNPPCIAVLYPGKSDALRGIILAALGMLGTPGEPIEGMQTVTIAGTAGAAHDDNVVIIAHPAEQLVWSVKQYKGLTSKPTLASSNKSFAKLSKKERQENALTIWANVDEVFAGLSKMFPEDKIPGQIRIADGIADFRNIDDLIVFFNIQENGIAFEENIAFKDGHHCLAYDLIRTPNLSRAGFEAVPSEAVGLLSIALGEAESAQAKAVGKSIENLTGLDIGREIFANI
ncbi:MAG: tetratricopeptide repeat protein, partial [Sedimentisphaerales bacterium]